MSLKDKIYSLPTDMIDVDNRFRKEFSSEELNALARSIQTVGQLQPIGVRLKRNGRYQLVYGHRRLLACKKLGIPVKAIILGQENKVVEQVLDDKILEFVENSVRQDFTPAEKAQAVLELHRALKERDPDWTVEQTASLLGLTRPYVSDLLKIGQHVKEGKIKDADKLSMRQLRSAVSTKQQVKTIKQSLLEQQAKDKEYKILLGDSFSFEKLGIEANSFNLVLTDPPYGLDYEVQSDVKSSKGAFNDNPAKFLNPEWIKQLLELFHRLTTPDGVVISFCSLEQFFLVRQLYQSCGWEYCYPKPLVWIKKAMGTPYQEYAPTSCYEVAFFLKKKKDTALLKTAFPDWFNVQQLPPQEKIHPTEKPVDLWLEILRSVALPHFSVVDPFSGSGSVIRACVHFGLPKAVGIEVHKDFYEASVRKLKELIGGDSHDRPTEA